MSSFAPGTAAQPTAEVELSISCRGLVGKDMLSKSDPMCVTYMQPFGEKRWVELHRTEQILNNHDPDFTSKINIVYRFEEQQQLKFEIYDIDNHQTGLEHHDFLGWASCSLGQIISNGQVKIPLNGVKNISSGDTSSGFLLISAEELAKMKDELVLQLSAVHLIKTSWFFSPHTFLVFHKSTESGTFVVAHKTEVAKRTRNPKWNTINIPVVTLCNGDYDRNLKVACYSHSSSGNHTLIGECFVTLKQLAERVNTGAPIALQNADKQKKELGQLKVDRYEIKKIYSFMDYIKGGTQLHCSFAIDFTGSNGDPLTPTSLHHISNVPNCYEQAIASVGSIIQDYDSDKQFPVLGFGARLPPDGLVSHEFFVNLHPSNPYCNGINGVLEAYRACIRQIQLYGPTNFAPVINHVARFAESYRDGSSYFILLILTDGVITDMPQTIGSIVKASTLPMSIIIVGVGNADFKAMEQLDADTIPLSSNGVRAQRDIVQFVPFNKFLTTGDPRTTGVRLAREVLAEIPRQFLGYMKTNNIAPKTGTSEPTFLPPDPEHVINLS